ncbi:hypothetical protein ADK53_11200 [Streptomyces sp. WM6373]|nr:hypothetical protein ADK53_11200 [Streptomyces sp. WM6373]KOU62865.1 hypothetical protein ADK96_24995 [Streptomyces sp. IGB124]KOU94539.1 hypothetical protein ADK93_04970 [Streptomyces sp. XY58]KOV10882.1 hypothetical protein ADK89_04950 [Streptomyces sp. XY37]KOV39295.1 hypothetical protein ADK97_09205 [Streptomyces sp. H021]KOV54190.1 hypothetical protein ADK99_05330 [Streptomyces sp. MMG1064]
MLGGALRHHRPDMFETSQSDPAVPVAVPDPVADEPRGCLFALSQPPLMIFLAVIGILLLLAAVHDLFLL